MKIATRFALVAALTLVAGLAAARPQLATPPQSDIKFTPPPLPARPVPPAPHAPSVPAPELAPGTVLGAATLLVGGLLVLRSRKVRG